jgi:hypothetical protein
MTTKPQLPTETTFDTVQVFRAIKEKISADLAGMTFDEIKAYLKAKSDAFLQK